MSRFVSQYYIRKFLFLFTLRLPLLKKLYVNTFPAVHLKSMDMWDYAWHFSSELIVAALVILVAGFNLFLLTQPDKSIAASFLSLHVGQNQKLYERTTATKTYVTKKTALISEAQADSSASPDPGVTDNAENEEDSLAITPTGMEAQNPDTVRTLLQKQIKIYTSESGDTLGSIGRKFNISIDTIKWANDLPNNTIKPGWNLVILPTNGLLINVGPNTTIPDLVKKYRGNQERIISFNGLENAEDLAPGDILICPDCELVVPPPAPAKPKPTTKPSTNRNIGINDGNEPVTGSIGGHIFPKGYCTWYVAKKTFVPWGGNAKQWLANARAYGRVVGNEPAPGSIVVTTDNARYGHVAYVEKVADGKILISEMNFEAFNKVNQRWISVSSKTIRGYIYP